MESILVKNFSKKFPAKDKDIFAVKNLSFSLQPGELVGFIGPNGAGKTTTLKALSGLLYPTSGFISVLGFDPWKKSEEFLKKISFVSGAKNQLWWDLPAKYTFELNKAIYEIPTKDYEDAVGELLKLLSVEKFMNVPVRKLSLGQRMKMELVASLLHRPEVLFLDEPTIGLDVVAKSNLRDFIYEYNKKYKATIILTSHDMDDLVSLTRRVLVINSGELVYDGMFEDLQTKFAPDKIIKVTFSEVIQENKLRSIGKVIKFKPPEAHISVPRSAVAIAASELLQNFPISDLAIEEVSIDDVIKKVFKNL